MFRLLGDEARIFAYVRRAFSVYLAWFWISLLLLPPALFYSPFNRAQEFLALLGLMGSLSLGFFPLFSPAIVWLLLVYVLFRNPLLYEIHLPYAGWMLLFFCLRELCRDLPSAKNRLRWLIRLAFASSYASSGIAKLANPDWVSGKMLLSFSQIGFLRFSFFDSFPALAPILALFIGLLEAAAFPLFLWGRSRPWIWLALTLLQLSLLLTASLEHISVMMLIFHLLAFEPAWLKEEGSPA